MVIAQGGGPTAVINQSLVGAVLEAVRYPQIKNIYGALHGVRGVRDGMFVDLRQTTHANLEAIAQTPSAALLSTRDKPDAAYCQKLFEQMKAHDIRYFFYIGGNDSSETVKIVSEYAEQAKYEMRAVHIPKTIDNDLTVTDHTPGFGSAARFVAQAFAGVNLDNRALPGVYLAVIMGRSAGFLTASSALARRYPDDGPHLIYVPEKQFVVDKFLDDVRRIYDQHGRCIVALSEGIWSEMDEKGKPKPMIVSIFEQQGQEVPRDSFGHPRLGGGALADTLVSLITEKLQIKRVRGDTFGYLQRSFVGCVSDVDQREAREVGQKAVQFACSLGKSGSVCMRRVGDYVIEYFLETDISKIGGKVQHMPDIWINEAHNDVTPAFIEYARPLIGKLPTYERLQVPKIENA
ncbi:MAG: 6-phosphofructokinase [Myxococcales bacterium]|nr:6-phosphofructokinase [Myxococcales bacterium]MCB9644184.1 6-phosphofructokinase [Myxococcales bacterium]